MPLARSRLPPAKSLPLLFSRDFHGTSAPSFLSSWLPHKRKTSKSELQSLKSAIQKQDVSAFSKQYSAVLQQQKISGPVNADSDSQAERLSAKDGQAALRLLASSRKRLAGSDFRRLRRIFTELETWFGVKHPVQSHHWLLLGMVRAKKAEDALRWIQAMPQSHRIQPGVQDWNVVLSGFSAAHGSKRRRREVPSLARFEDVWQNMLRAGIQPDIVSYNNYLRAVFAQDPVPVDSIAKVREYMSKANVKPTTHTLSILLEGYTAMDNYDQARDICKQLLQSAALDTAAWNSVINFSGHFEGAAAVWKQWQAWQSSVNPPEPDAYTFSHFVRYSELRLLDAANPVQAALDELKTISERCDLDPSAWSCADLIQRILALNSDASRTLAMATELYHQVIFGPEAIMPHSAMVNPLLERLLAIESPDRLQQAQRLFATLQNAEEEGYAPDLGVCHSMLRICETCGPPGVEAALGILDYMRDQRIAFDKAETVVEHVEGLFGACDSYPLAFKAYSWIRSVDPAILDRGAYNRILTAFSFIQLPASNSSAGGSQVAPQFFLEIIKDMRSSGHGPDTITYTLLLEYYSRRYRRADQIRRLHDIIKVDLQYDPDIRLHNALIVAYGYVGDTTAAVRVWQALMANRHRPNMGINHATNSAIIDVCAFSDNRRLADQIWKSIKTDKHIQPNKRNWDTWIECLGRFQALDEACDVVLQEMGSSADHDTVDILLKFAKRADMYESTFERLSKERPELVASRS